MFESLKNVKLNSFSNEKSVMSDFYKNEFIEFYKPCKNAFMTVLEQRMELLIGEWIEWDT